MKLNRLELWLRRIWLGSVLWTTLAFAVPAIASGIIVVLIFSLVGSPLGLAFGLLPTVALYFTIAAPPYLLLRRKSRPLAALAGASFALAIGLGVPKAANDIQSRKFDGLIAENKSAGLHLDGHQTVAYLYDYRDDFDWYRGCDDHCQRLLFSGAADGVILGDTSSLDGAGQLRHFWIAKANGDCPDVWTPDVYASDEDVGKSTPYPRPRLTRRLTELEAKGMCLFEGRGTLGDADVVLARWYHPEAGDSDARFDPRLVPLDRWSASAIYLKSGNEFRALRRQIHVAGHSIASPLRLEAPFIFDTYTPGRWGSGGFVEYGHEPEFGLTNFVTNDLRVDGLLSTSARR